MYLFEVDLSRVELESASLTSMASDGMRPTNWRRVAAVAGHNRQVDSRTQRSKRPIGPVKPAPICAIKLLRLNQELIDSDTVFRD